MNRNSMNQAPKTSSGAKLFSIAAMMGLVLLVTQLAAAQTFSFNTGIPDGKLGAASRPASPEKVETETADDFRLLQTTVINGATIIGLIPAGTPLANIKSIEVEVYHVFPQDSAPPVPNRVPTRDKSPADVEIASATRASASGTLTFSPSVTGANLSVDNTVVNGIKLFPDNLTNGEGPSTGDQVELTITFTTPIILPAGDYFFRPEVLLTNGDFLYVSAPKPILPPGNAFVGDRQAWIRNSRLSPDWLRIGTDIIGGTAFNMAFSLAGQTVPNAGTPGQTNCNGKTLAALSEQFGTLDEATSVLGFSSVAALHHGFNLFCQR